MSTTLQDMQPQQSSVHLQQENKVELSNFLQTIADGFLVLIEENKQRGEQIEALSREIARLTHSGLQAPLTLATETSCRSGHGNDEAVCRRLEKINLEINALRAEIERQPVVKNQSGEKRRQAPEGCSQPQDQKFSRPDGRPPGENPRPAQPRKVQREADEPAADSVYTFANVFYRANDLLGNSDGKRLVFSGNLEHVPLLPILAIIYFQQNLLPAFERVAMLLG